MTTKEFIDSIDFISEKLRKKLYEWWEEELPQELNEEVKWWIVESIEDVVKDWAREL